MVQREKAHDDFEGGCLAEVMGSPRDGKSFLAVPEPLLGVQHWLHLWRPQTKDGNSLHRHGDQVWGKHRRQSGLKSPALSGHSIDYHFYPRLRCGILIGPDKQAVASGLEVLVTSSTKILEQLFPDAAYFLEEASEFKAG
ncbi:putative uncharacterized protein encoded by LINC00299 [Pongo pygmaeus]|uniref:putative uncharacterized protein encoded by LINC00299 n=1 Tax=Pongo abelii TaxID=9601 RepID=UPI0023E0FDE9|nr:putative uncharacterized protein encoded by LINC00299 [Pongo abelii]XP_054330785.1 putative uncharacterized protein encoded by LINC00299 [Pongo pygmaeus]